MLPIGASCSFISFNGYTLPNIYVIMKDNETHLSIWLNDEMFVRTEHVNESIEEDFSDGVI